LKTQALSNISSRLKLATQEMNSQTVAVSISAGYDSGSSFGVSASGGSGSWGISVQASGSRGWAVSHNETVIQGGQGVEFASVNDTTPTVALVFRNR
jgi:hypothetical protein